MEEVIYRLEIWRKVVHVGGKTQSASGASVEGRC